MLNMLMMYMFYNYYHMFLYKIYILHSINDFLLSEDDKKFLDSTLEKRMIWTSRGGHLGQLYYKSVQQKIIDILR